jgi:hypothetical protein
MALGSGVEGCESPLVPKLGWETALQFPDRFFHMSFKTEGTALTGSAWIASLTNPGAREDFSLVGTQRADTLAINYQRDDGAQFRFDGWYIANRTAIRGVLDGGEFSRTAVTFLRR